MKLLVAAVHADLPHLPEVGRLVIPRLMKEVELTATAGIPWACDNDGFGGFGKPELHRFRRMIDRVRLLPGCLWVAVPDVLMDHARTLESFWKHLPDLEGLPAAFVLQNGVTPDQVPWDHIDAVFIGGDNDFKLGPDAYDCAVNAKGMGKLVHMGRVNSRRRMRLAVQYGADSIDGTKFARWRGIHLLDAVGWLQGARDQMHLEVPCALARCSPASASSTTGSPSPAMSMSGSSSETPTDEASWLDDGQEQLFSTTSGTSGQTSFPVSMPSPGASPARARAWSGPGLASLIQRLLCGPSSLVWLASCDLATPSSRTWRTSSLSMTEPSGEPFSQTWPRSGMTWRGIAYQLPPSVPRTSVTGSSPLLGTPAARDWKGTGYDGQLMNTLLPTPRTSDSNGAGLHGDGGMDLRTAVALLPTPRSSRKEMSTYTRTPSQEAGNHGKYLGVEILSLLPTPVATSYGSNQGGSMGRTGPVRPSLETLVKSSGEPSSPPSDAGKPSMGLRLSPWFVEWMLGAPQGWSDPDCPLSATEFKSMSGA